jgi:hypothetical protein
MSRTSIQTTLLEFQSWNQFGFLNTKTYRRAVFETKTAEELLRIVKLATMSIFVNQVRGRQSV